MRNLSTMEQYLVEDIKDLSTLMDSKAFIREYAFHTTNETIRVIASNSLGWDHINAIVQLNSIFPEYRMPNAEEMKKIKNMFFSRNEPVMEVHPKKEDYVNINPNVLHLWKPNLIDLPVPPNILEFTEVDLIRTKRDRKLLIKRGEMDGWIAYRVSVLEYGLPRKAKPSWDDMCIAKKALIGEDEIALQYHARGLNEDKYSLTLWLPPKEIELPLPEAFLVGIRNDKDDEDACRKIMLNPHEYMYRK